MNADNTLLPIGVGRRSSAAKYVLAFFSSLLKRRRAEGEQETGRDESVGSDSRGWEHAPQRLAELRGRTSDQGAKPGAESPQALIAHGETDFGDGAVILGEQLFRAVDAAAGQEIVRSFTKRS